MLYLQVWLSVNDPANVATVKELLTQAAQLSRGEPGCIRFEVYQSQADEQRFLLSERWESQDALNVHRTGTAYTTIYQPKVLPLVTREGHPCTLIE